MRVPFEAMMNPEKYGLKECSHCNGYGSSLKEAAPKCTQCGGSGLVPKHDAMMTKQLFDKIMEVK